MENKKNFIVRLIIFLLFAIAIPCVYITIRFGLFTSKDRVSLWGLIVIAVIFITVTVMVKYYLDGMKTKWSYTKQLVNGLIKVILPLLFFLLVMCFIKSKMEWLIDNINLFIETILIIIGCETIAILVNPLSKWAFENNVNGFVEITDKILKRGK